MSVIVRGVRLLTVLVVALCLAGFVDLAQAQSHDERFLQGLRSRRLFVLAEKFCQDRLADPTLDARGRARWSIEWSQTCAEHALQATLDQREAQWAQALQVLKPFSLKHSKHSQETLVEAQAATVLLMQGELLRQEAELVADQGARVERARTLLRDAIARFQVVGRQINEQLRERNREMNTTPDVLTTIELGNLEKNVRLQRARALRNQAQTYAPGSADRVAALDSAIIEAKALVGLDPADPLCFAGRIEELVALRLLDDAPAMVERLTSLGTLNPSPETRWRASAEQLRMLTVKHLPTAITFLERTDAAESVSPDWQDAALETEVAAWKQADGQKNAADTARWQQAASRRVGWIERHAAPYWARRAETRIAGQIATAPASGDGDALKRSAESFYRSGQIDQALLTYDELTRRATADQQAARAFEAAFTAAAIEQQRQNFTAAAKRFRTAALAAPQLEKARDAHLAAIYATAKASDPPTSAATQAYLELLAEHLQKWPSGATSDQARLWLAQVHVTRREYPAAVEALNAIDRSSSLFPAARQTLASAYLAWIAHEQSAQRPVSAIATQGAASFEKQLTRGRTSWPEFWADPDREAAVIGARLWLDYVPARADRAEQLLRAALDHAEGTSAEWKAQTKLLLVQALVVQNQLSAVEGLIQELGINDDERLLRLLDDWREQAEQATGDTRAALGKLSLLVAARRGNERPLEKDAQRRFDLNRGIALLAVNKRDESLAVLKPLAIAYPQDGMVQESLARAVSSGSKPEDQQEALTLWRAIERRSRPGTERWFRAKLELARCHMKLGNKAQAEQIVELTRLLHPDLGGPKMKAAFTGVFKRE